MDNNWLDIKGYSNKWRFKTENSEHLLYRVVGIASQRDVCLDFFAGSGTTAAVAHKMMRRYIAIEFGNHSETVLLRRMKSVVYKEQSGVSAEPGWKGGGFFKYYELEQFEDTLRRTHYADYDPVTPNEPLCYLFLRDTKQTNVLQIKDNAVQIYLDRLYPNIDLAETLSNLQGKPIQRIVPDLTDPTRHGKVVFTDGSEVDLQNPDWRLIKPLIWW
ncbi:MAG: DNA methyltransferase [Methylacidiphilales bacterium]|nr:DNA methyltransferase [Candidatus Methylacidiphilales bacterium]